MNYRYFIQLSFYGEAYHGWQLQKDSNSVQDELCKALSVLLKSEITVTGAGRTDAGVHAKDFYAHFDSEKNNLNENNFVFRLNKLLPRDIAVKKIYKVKPDAHARFDAVSRTYVYRIMKNKNPFYINSAYYYYGDLNIDMMNKASEILFKYSDFTSFSKVKTQTKTNNCKIMKAEWEQKEDLILFTIKANRFLRNMVRAIVGTMMEVGRDKISLKDFRNIIESKNRSNAGYSVPAKGLFLINVEYPGKIFL
ncbi:MAG: tRNA pseudouridine(38-40) synthase TruA [Bacteroidales bacterium]|nr:tRNA pseudouridine(38-40) synthase TruA [Bacteroidales bacterium]